MAGSTTAVAATPMATPMASTLALAVWPVVDGLLPACGLIESPKRGSAVVTSTPSGFALHDFDVASCKGGLWQFGAPQEHGFMSMRCHGHLIVHAGCGVSAAVMKERPALRTRGFVGCGLTRPSDHIPDPAWPSAQVGIAACREERTRLASLPYPPSRRSSWGST